MDTNANFPDVRTLTDSDTTDGEFFECEKCDKMFFVKSAHERHMKYCNAKNSKLQFTALTPRTAKIQQQKKELSNMTPECSKTSIPAKRKRSRERNLSGLIRSKNAKFENPSTDSDSECETDRTKLPKRRSSPKKDLISIDDAAKKFGLKPAEFVSRFISTKEIVPTSVKVEKETGKILGVQSADLQKYHEKWLSLKITADDFSNLTTEFRNENSKIMISREIFNKKIVQKALCLSDEILKDLNDKSWNISKTTLSLETLTNHIRIFQESQEKSFLQQFR